MTPEIFTLAESGSIKNGQVCILHTCSNLLTTAFPARVSAVIVSQVRFRLDEQGDHTEQIVMVNADGKELWISDVKKFFIQHPPKCETFAFASLTLLQLDVFEPGQHDVTLFIDGREVISVPCGVSLVK